MATNYEAYRSLSVVGVYEQSARDGLTTPERYCLDLVPNLKRHSILDIGIGGGRTISALSSIFKKYTGIDYSEEMIAAAKSLYPNADLKTMDARKLEFEKSFDCVMFSFNGIDCVTYTDRQLILQQIANVLRPGGYLIYSTHNLQNRQVPNLMNSLGVRDLIRPLRGFFRPWKRFPRIRN